MTITLKVEYREHDLIEVRHSPGWLSAEFGRYSKWPWLAIVAFDLGISGYMYRTVRLARIRRRTAEQIVRPA